MNYTKIKKEFERKEKEEKEKKNIEQSKEILNSLGVEVY
jgi:hypothetical protein